MLNAAIELIVEQGARVSMMAIGERSGFSHGLVLARFGSKAALLEAVVKEAQRRFTKTLNAVGSEAAGIEKLYRLIDVFFQSPSKVGKTAFAILHGESLGPDPQLRAVFTRADEAFRKYVEVILREAQAIGDIDPAIATDAMAVLIVGMLRGVSLQYRVNPKAFKVDAVRAEAHAFLARLASTEVKATR